MRNALYWRDLIADETHIKEYKLRIDGTDYFADSLIDMTSVCDIFSGGAPVVGQCISAKLTTSLYLPIHSIPRRAICIPYARLTNGSRTTSWMKNGEFFIDKRMHSKNGVFRIEAYDAMRRADKLMYANDGQQEYWPKTDIDVVNIIASEYLGVTVNQQTVNAISEGYDIQFPGYGESGYTVRQVLGYIGAMYGGNWIIDDDGRLKLLKLSDFPHEADPGIDHNIMDSAEEYDELIPFESISRVTINVGTDETSGDSIFYTSGDDTASEFVIECPWGTQEIADTLVSELSTFVYRPYTLTNAIIDPAFELWDGVYTNNTHTGISAYTRYFENPFSADISATGEEEIDSEYPYVSKEELKNRQSNARQKASLILTNQTITSEITRTDGAMSLLRQDIDGIQLQIVRIDTEGPDSLSKYLRFTADGLELGIPDSNTKTLLTEVRLEFHDATGDVKAYIGEDPRDNVYKLFVIKGHIVNELEHGEHWSVITSDSGTLHRLTIKARR